MTYVSGEIAQRILSFAFRKIMQKSNCRPIHIRLPRALSLHLRQGSFIVPVSFGLKHVPRWHANERSTEN